MNGLKQIAEVVYLLSADGGHYKIGRSGDAEERSRVFKMLPFNVRLIHEIETDDAGWLEKFLHGVFDDKRVIGEWFKLTPTDVEALRKIASRNRPLLSLRIVEFPKPAAASAPKRQREGYQTVVWQMPELLLDRLEAEAEAAGIGVGPLVMRILCEYFGVSLDQLPQGRPPNKRKGRRATAL